MCHCEDSHVIARGRIVSIGLWVWLVICSYWCVYLQYATTLHAKKCDIPISTRVA